MIRYFRHIKSGAVIASYLSCNYVRDADFEEVIVTPKPKPVVNTYKVALYQYIDSIVHTKFLLTEDSFLKYSEEWRLKVTQLTDWQEIKLPEKDQ